MLTPSERAALSRIERDLASSDPGLEKALGRLQLRALASLRRVRVVVALCMLAPIATFVVGCLLDNITMVVVAVVVAPVCPFVVVACFPRGRRRLRRSAKEQDERRLSEPRE